MEYPETPQRETVAELYEAFGHLVFARCKYLLRDDTRAQDAAHEVFLKVLSSYDAFRSESSPLTWMIKIATNHCLNVLASSRAGWWKRFEAYRQHVHETSKLEIGGVDPYRARVVRRVLDRVDEETQQIAIHYYVDEMTQEEISAALGRSVPTIRKRLEKFLRVAQKELGHGFD